VDRGYIAAVLRSGVVERRSCIGIREPPV
jgi:hypothetical protein